MFIRSLSDSELNLGYVLVAVLLGILLVKNRKKIKNGDKSTKMALVCYVIFLILTIVNLIISKANNLI